VKFVKFLERLDGRGTSLEKEPQTIKKGKPIEVMIK
jgi:hypothetical protein